MAIPQRVREAAAEADQQLQQLAAGNVPPAPAPASNDPPPAPAAAPTPVSEGGAPPPPPANENVPPAPAPTAAPTSAETELQRLQQQLSTEAGRRQAQEAEAAELRGRLQAMQELMQRQPAAPAAPAAPPPPLITEEDRKDFGEDMIDFVQRVFRQSMGSALDNLLREVNVIKGQLRQIGTQAQTAARTAEETAAERYFGSLDTNVPGWRQTNDDPQFVDWLQNRDTFSRKTRHELLTSAHAAADAETVAEFFRAYWKEKGIAPANTPAPTAAPPAQPAQPTVDPATLVAPTPSSAPSPAANPRGGKIWTQAEIEAVYDDRMKKRLTAEDFAAKEREIELAVIEGRVQ